MDLETLSLKIKSELDNVNYQFSAFQQSVGLSCPPNCGKCCINPEIACHPYELLPLALKLLQEGLAEAMLEKAKNNIGKNCILLNVINEEFGLARCEEYEYRPSLCRAFGVAGRRNKKHEIEFSVCKTLKEKNKNIEIKDEEVPFIDQLKIRLEAFDPIFLGPHLPVNEALAVILEKVLVHNYFKTMANSSS